MIRRQVLQLYKDIVKATRSVPDETYKKDLLLWARNDFKRNKNLKDGVNKVI